MRPGEGYEICTSVDDVVKHVRHIGDNYGYNIVGIGGDFNGAEAFPHDAENVSKYPNVIAKLIESFEHGLISC